MNNFLSNDAYLRQKVLNLAKELGLLPNDDGVTFGGHKKMPRYHYIINVWYMGLMINKEPEAEDIVFQHVQQFTDEIDKPEYDCIFASEAPGERRKMLENAAAIFVKKKLLGSENRKVRTELMKKQFDSLDPGKLTAGTGITISEDNIIKEETNGENC